MDLFGVFNPTANRRWSSGGTGHPDGNQAQISEGLPDSIQPGLLRMSAGAFPNGQRTTEGGFDLAGKKDIRQQALDDPDLEPLWGHKREI